MKPKKKSIGCFLVISTLVLSLLFVGCSQKPEVKALTKVNIACFPNITHAQALLMKEEGTMEKAFGDGVSVNWITFNAGPSEIEALFAGEVDIGYIGPVPAASGYVQSNGDLRIIAGASNGGAILVARNNTNIHSAADLDGKKVAIPQFGNTQHLSLLNLLRQNGLAPTTSGGTVEVVPAANADVANLIEQSAIDAALVPEPWGSIMELTGSVKVVLDYDKIDSKGISSTAVVIVRKTFLDSYPEAVESFMKAHKEATAYILDHEDDAKKKINSQIKKLTQKPIDTGVLDKAFRRMEITYDIPSESIFDLAAIAVEEKIVKSMPDQDLIEDRFIK